MSRRFIIGVFIFVFLFFAVSKTYACPGSPPTAFISGPYTKYACVGCDFTFEGGESHDNDDLPTTQCCIDNYSWSGGGTPSSQSGSNSSFTTKWDTTGGPHTINLTVTDNETMTHSTSCTVYVVEVENVTVDKTIACVLETVTFTANPYPSVKPLDCIEWQKQYRPPGSETWGDWETASGGDNTAELNTGTAGYYQYRARNGSGDTWEEEKESDEVTIYTVQTVQWETYPDDVVVPPPDPDHGPNLDLDWVDEGEQRIFPGKKCYGDTTAEAAMRRKVRVKATTTPVVDNRRVYFSWWDIDDPSTDDPPIDPNGSTGDDNKGEGETLSPTYTVTNGSGEARVTFTVAMQPGDNYKIAASINQTKLGEMTQPMADGQEGLPDTVVLSEDMLTTWRKLWIERDYMAPVPSTGGEMNRVLGTADSCTYNQTAGETTVDLGRLLPYWFDDIDQFEGGCLKFTDSGNTYPVISSTHNLLFHDEVVVTGNCSTESDKSYILFDDDDQTLLDSPYYCALGSHEAAFRDAYIEPEYLSTGSYSDEVNFNLNLTDTEIGSGVDYDNEQDVWSNSGFWACLVVSCYQPTYTEDSDPDGWGIPLPEQDPAITWGATYNGDTDNASMIFLETVKNEVLCFWSEGQVVAHEMGAGGGVVDHGSVHCYMNLNTTDPNHFCDDCKQAFRYYETWLTTN